MKFAAGSFWKHENGMDAFLVVHGVNADDGRSASLVCEWLCQGVDHYWTCPIPEQRHRGAMETILLIEVNAENYDKWKPYAPRGTYLSPGDQPKYPKDPDLSL